MTAIAAVILSLLFVNLFAGSDSTQAATPAEQKLTYGWPAAWYLRDWRFFLPQNLAKVGPQHPYWFWASPAEDRFAFFGLALFGDAVVAGVVLLGVVGGLGGQRVAPSLRTDVAISLALSARARSSASWSA